MPLQAFFVNLIPKLAPKINVLSHWRVEKKRVRMAQRVTRIIKTILWRRPRFNAELIKAGYDDDENNSSG